MQVNMDNDSDHFLSDSLEFQTHEEKVDLNDISVKHIAEDQITLPSTAKSKSSVECPVCFVKFTQKNNLSRHMQRFHGVKPPRSHLQLKTDPSLPECSECSLKFTRKSNLLRHMKKFHKFLAPCRNPELPKIFSCTECDSKFTQWKNCVRHMRNLHSVGDFVKEEVEEQPPTESENHSVVEDNMECVIEVDPFPVISPLRIENISMEPNNLPESVCSTENQLSESNSNHKDDSSPKNSKVMCTECGLGFSTPFNLRRHTKRLHEGRDDRYGVIEAIRAVKTSMLRETFPDDLPDCKLLLRTCPECQVSFSSPSNLRRHIRRVHEEPDSAADSACAKRSDSSENRLFCSLCTEPGVSFSTPSNLRRHIRRIHPQNELETGAVVASAAADQTRITRAGHPDANRLSCPQCPEGSVTFSTPSNLRRHMRKFHPPEEDAKIEEPLIDTAEIRKCPRCDYRENRLNLYVHFNLVHGLQVVIEYQVFDSETQLDEWLSQISPEAQFVVRNGDSNRMVISCSQPNRADEFCPAEMMIVTESGKCTVHHVKTHVHES